MSGREGNRADAHQQHLEAAYARDLPIALTRYAAPELIGRRAIRYSEMLDYLYEQRRWSRGQQRQHQPTLVLPGSVLGDVSDRVGTSTASLAGRGGYHNGRGEAAVPSLADSVADTRRHDDDDDLACRGGGDASALLERVLPVAVGKGPTCTSDVHVQTYCQKDWLALAAVGMSVAALSAAGQAAQGSASTTTTAAAGASTVPSRYTYTALVEHEDRQRAQALAMRYLLRGVPSTSAAAADGRGDGDDSGDDDEQVPAETSIGEAAKAAGVDLEELPTCLFPQATMNNDLLVNMDVFYGIREVRNEQPEYITTLADWSMTLNEADADATSLMPLVNETPAFLRHLLKAAVVQTGDNALDGTASTRAALVSTEQVRHAATTLEAYAYHPLVKPKPDQVMDSLLPPRLLLFFDIDPATAAREHKRRAARDHRIRELLLEYYRDDGDGTSSKMQQLLGEVRSQHAEKHAEDAVVGTAFLLVEQASREPCAREGLLQLEHDLEALLVDSGARCWGAPIYMCPQSSNFLGTVKGNEAMAQTMARRQARQLQDTVGATRVLKPSPPPGPRHATVAPSSGKNNLSARLQATTSAVGHTGNGNNKNNGSSSSSVKASKFFASTIQQGTVPAVQDPTSGGTATVMATLNMLELSVERTTLLLHLLRGELLRQVTLDSPECGVLLSRVLAEADVSLAARDVVLRESVVHAQENLDQGQTTRESLRLEEAALEKELVALRAKLVSAQTRKRSLENWIDERKTLERSKVAQEKNFQDLLLERLQRYADEVRDAQDRDRRGSVDTTTA